jgi:hypothetical protein
MEEITGAAREYDRGRNVKARLAFGGNCDAVELGGFDTVNE